MLNAARELLSGGKRLRPAFCYWGWRAAGGGDEPGIFVAAASLELLQASALVHDDVMDKSDLRRGHALRAPPLPAPAREERLVRLGRAVRRGRGGPAGQPAADLVR
ncbi:polyprenyl synthetase family protein [Nonomuraea dietziae]|uniref:polyprenyl synthetase family protein n=1 Tax=Nonomuraea dietziae TaxID=65515 RepID=UPI0031D0F66C